MSEPAEPTAGDPQVPAEPSWQYAPPPPTIAPPVWAQFPSGPSAAGPYAPMGGYGSMGGYAPPGGYGPVGGYPGPGYGPAPVGSRRTLLVSTIVVAVVVAVGLAVAIIVGLSAHGSQNGPNRTLTVPASFDAYHHLTSQLGQNVEDQMRIRISSNSAIEKQVYQNSIIAVYARSTELTPDIVFIAVNARGSSTAADLLGSSTPANNADKFLRGAGVDQPSGYAAGPLGGALRCGVATGATPAYTSCLWMDRATFGVVLSVGDSSEAALAKTTLDIRAAAEH